LASWKFEGLEEYLSQLKQLKDISRSCIGQAVYSGAGVVADAMRDAIEALPIDEKIARNGQTVHGIGQAQKQGLLDGFGIAKMQDDNGYLHVKLGFDGRNTVRTPTFPTGQPNALIARSVNAGTSFRDRIPFIDDTLRQTKKQCEQAMKERFDEELGKAIK
jgi:HK97 gp10 family phage protein